MFWGLLLIIGSGFALYGLVLLTCRLACRLRNRSIANPYLSLLFVVRDQAAVIEGLTRDILSYYRTPLSSFELVIVDDHSADETPEILRRLNREKAFTLVSPECSPEEKPLELGLRTCRGELVSYFNLTGNVSPRLVSRLVGRLLKGEEIRDPLGHCAVTFVRRTPQAKYLKV